jgi:hypothetical protein
MMTQSHAIPVATKSHGVLARYFNEFRIAAYVLVLYALGHTFGALVSTPQFGAESDAVVASMKTVHFVTQGVERTWYGFYLGFGAFDSVFFAMSVYIAWRLGGAAAQDRRILLPIGWALLASHAVGAVLAVVYFFPVPIAFSAVVTVLLAVGCVRTSVALRTV